MNKGEILRAMEFMTDNPFAVFSTANKAGECWGAVVYTIAVEEEGKFACYFITRETSRKYQNTLENKHVALTYYDQKTVKTLQIAGTVEDFKSTTSRMEMMKLINSRMHENFAGWAPVMQLTEGAIVVVRVMPVHIAFSVF